MMEYEREIERALECLRINSGKKLGFFKDFVKNWKKLIFLMVFSFTCFYTNHDVIIIRKKNSDLLSDFFSWNNYIFLAAYLFFTF